MLCVQQQTSWSATWESRAQGRPSQPRCPCATPLTWCVSTLCIRGQILRAASLQLLIMDTLTTAYDPRAPHLLTHVAWLLNAGAGLSLQPVQVAAGNNLSVGFNRVFDWDLAAALSRIYRRHAHLFEGKVGPEYNLARAANCQSIREFDDALTKVSFGWRSVDDYYAGDARRPPPWPSCLPASHL